MSIELILSITVITILVMAAGVLCIFNFDRGLRRVGFVCLGASGTAALGLSAFQAWWIGAAIGAGAAICVLVYIFLHGGGLL